MTTTVTSVIAHLAVLAVVILIPLWYFNPAPPVPAEMLAFITAAPAPPPPPPPPPPPVARAPEPRRPIESSAPVNPQAAPVEAPARVEAEHPIDQPVGTSGTVGVDRGIVGGVEGGVSGGVSGGVVGGLTSAAPPPPPPPPDRGPVRVGGQLKAPALVTRTNPEYPYAAQQARVEGDVVLEAVVDEAGRVQSVKVIRSRGLLDQAAIDAVKQWRYAPLQLNGEATPFVVTVTVQFSLGNRR